MALCNMRACTSQARIMTARGRAAVARPLRPVRAEEEGKSLSLSTDTRQATEGFVLKDSAGQTNMYPTVTKAYEAGSSADKSNEETNTSAAIGAAVAAAALIGGGLVVLSGSQSGAPVETFDFSQFKTLSAYSAEFSAELAPAPAPAVAAPSEP